MADTVDAAVVIPTYRRPDSLMVAITSAVEQCPRPSEVIVVVSDPEELSSLKMRIGKDFESGTLKFVSAGVRLTGGGARNLGVRAATSRVIFFLDDDDYFYPGKLAAHLDYHKKSNAVVVYSEAMLLYEDGATSHVRLKASGPVNFLSCFSRPGILPSSTSCVSIQHDAFTAVGGFDATLESYQDFDLWYRLAQTQAKFCAVNKPLTAFVQHSAPRVSSGGDKRRRAGDIVLEKHCNNLEIEKLIKNDRASLAGRMALVAAHAGRWSAVQDLWLSVASGETPLIRRETAASFLRIIYTLNRHLMRAKVDDRSISEGRTHSR